MIIIMNGESLFTDTLYLPYKIGTGSASSSLNLGQFVVMYKF